MPRPSLIILCLLIATLAQADILDVWPDGSGTYPSIQAAVNAASTGDVVALHEGTFTGPGNRDIVISGNIEIRANGAPGTAIIDCQQQPRAVVTEYCDATFYGIVFRNGVATRGGSVFIESGQPAFERCVFEDNAATEAGGAVFITEEAVVSFERCTFARNHSDGDGGAIMVKGWSALDLSRCTFLVNGADQGGHVNLIEGSILHLDRSVLAYAHGGGAVRGYYCGDITADCTDVFGNRGGDWADVLQGAAGSNHFDADPEIIDPMGGDYRMHPASSMWNPGGCGVIGAGTVADVGDEVVYGLRPDGRGMFADLEAAMAGVPNRAIIVLDDGVYEGAGYRDLNPGSRELTIRSRSGDPSACVLDADSSGDDNHRVFDLRDGDGSPLLVQGIGLAGGNMSNVGESGGLVIVGAGVAASFQSCHFGIAQAQSYAGLYAVGTSGELIDVSLIDCTAQSPIGVRYCRAYVEGCTIVGPGSGLSLLSCGDSTVRSCLFQDCTGYAAAGLYIGFGSGTTQVISTDFVNCRADLQNPSMSNDGGAVYLRNPGQVTLSGCDFTGCHADSSGSDLYVDVSSGTHAVSLEGCHFEASDEVTLDHGGSVYLDGVTADFNECTWDGYQSTRHGGTIYAVDSTVSLLESRITGSVASMGGAIYQDGGSLGLDSVGIYDNEADSGGGLYSSGALTCDYSAFKTNTAEAGGGAVTLRGNNNTFNFDRTVFQENACETTAAAMFVGHGNNTANVNQCTFYANAITGPVGIKGQIQVSDQSRLELYHSLVTHGVEACAVYGLPDHDPIVTVYCSNVFGNGRGDWIGPLWNQLQDDENLNVDPQYCDPSGQLTVAATSPCLPDNNACSTLIGAYGQGCDGTVAVPELPMSMAGPVLHGARPNPFNPSTSIAYELPRDAVVTLVVHEVNGRRVRTLRAGVAECAGRHEAMWNGLDDGGRPAGSGVYLVRLVADGVAQVQRVALIK